MEVNGESDAVNNEDLSAGSNKAELSQKYSDTSIDVSCRGVSIELLGVRDDLMRMIWEPIL